MANVDAPFNPRQLKLISVIVDKDTNGADFRNCVQSFQLTPQQTVSSTTGGTPSAVYTDLSPAVWQAQVKFLQDAETLLAFTDWLIAHAGEVHTIDFVPYGGTGWRITCIVPAAPIGGDMNSWLADTVTFAVRGKPSRTVDDVATPQQ